MRAPLLLTGLALFLLASASPQTEKKPGVAFIGLHGGVFQRLKQAEADAGLHLEYVTDADLNAGKADFSRHAVVFVQHTDSAARESWRQAFLEAKSKNPKLHILALPPFQMQAFLDEKGSPLAKEDAAAARYFSASPENLRRLLGYVRVKYLNLPGEVLPPAETPVEGLHHPESAERFESVEKFLSWAKEKGREVAKAPRAMVAVHADHLAFQQPRVVDALVHALEKEGVLAVAVVDNAKNYESLVEAFKPGVMVHTCHSGESVEFRQKLGVPHMASLFFKRQSIAEWEVGPQGLANNEVAFQIIPQEMLGQMEPLAGAGTLSGGGSEEDFTPLPGRVEHIARRAASWLRLREKPAAKKRVALVYYNREMGKSDLAMGTASGMFLNAPRSLVKVLQRMKAEGYALSPVPANEEELLSWMQERGRQIGIWAPGVLDRLAASGQAVLVPAAQYESWFNQRVPPEQQEEVTRRWGPAPGRFLIWENKGEKYIVIPRIDLGNVILLPQPLRGEAHEPDLTHDRSAPPPHNYLATYFWLEENFKADALIHFGTHGSEINLPGKSAGLSHRDWPDIVMGAMPNMNPWIIQNLGESSPAKRRAYAVLISHLEPPIVDAGLSDELRNLMEETLKWAELEEGALREKFREQISAQVRKLNLDKELHLPESELLSADAITRVAEYLHQIEEEITPTSLHVLGEPPREDLLLPYLVTALRGGFMDALGKLLPAPPDRKRFAGGDKAFLRKKAEELVGLVVRKNMGDAEALRAVGARPGRKVPEQIARGLNAARNLAASLARTHEEVDNLMAALEGKFVPPGPGNSPVRNPASVPTGRNIYLFNPNEVPSRASWELGQTLVEQTLAGFLKAHGRYPQQIAFDLSSFATFQDYGVMEAQILYLLGVEPVWDEKGLVREVRVIPRERLKRPRIDVFIASNAYYFMNLPGRSELMDKALRMAAAQEEADNGVRARSQAMEKTLQEKGMTRERAARLSTARIFSTAPGQFMNADYYYLVERSALWDKPEQLMQAYLSQVRYAYTQGEWGQLAPEAYDAAIQGTDMVLRTWSDVMSSPLSNKYTWYKGGSLAAAVKHLTGNEPDFYLSDVRNPDGATMVRAEDALHREYRVRLFNRKWLEGMMKEGYAGAGQIQKMVSNTYGWAIMRPGSVGEETWREITEVLLDDKYKLGLADWFEKSNPHALQELLEVALEAARKGYWKPDEALLRKLSTAYADSIARHGEGAGMLSGGNVKLEEFVDASLLAPGANVDEALIAAYHQRRSEVTQAPSRATTPVVGTRLEEVSGSTLQAKKHTLEWGKMAVAAAAFLLFVLGFIRKRRS